MNLNPFINLFSAILTLYGWCIFVYIVFGWLIHFDVINRYNPVVHKVNEVLRRLIDPVLSKIRRYMPRLGGIDLSPIILILGIYFVQDAMYSWLYDYGAHFR